MRFIRVLCTAVIAGLAGPATALAQDPGVFIDPDSPSAKEYAIPLESERRAADPEQEQSDPIAQGERSSAPFGAGIVEEAAPEAAAEPEGRRRGDASSRQRGTGRAETRAAEPAERRRVLQAATQPGAPAGGVGMPLTVAGAGLAVLLAGALTGLLLRRRRG